ncbi:MAG: transglycosylase SLT domain-containing protein [bacterium]
MVPQRGLASLAVFAALALVGGPFRASAEAAALSDLARLDSTERVDVLVAAGLEKRAEGILRSRIAKGDSTARAPLLALLLQRNDAHEASKLLTSWGGAKALDGEAPSFMAARVHEASDRTEEACREYQASAAREPLLADHATYRAALALERLGRVDEALTALEAAGDAARTPSLAAVALFRAAGLAAGHGQTDRAQQLLDRVPARSPIAAADRLELQGHLDRARGDAVAEARTLRALIAAAPATDAALESVGRLEELEPPTAADRLRFAEVALAIRDASRAETEVDAALHELGKTKDPKLEGRARLLRGKAEVLRHELTAAREEFARVPADADSSDRGEAALEAARCLWRLDRIDACLAEYDAIADGRYPAATRLTAAREAARETKDDRRWEEAALRYDELVRLLNAKDGVDDALWQRGRALAETGDRSAALATFEELRAKYPDSPRVSESTYWSARLLRAAGDTSGACRDAARLVRERPDDFWAQRARELRAALACARDSVDMPAPDRDVAEWLGDSTAASSVGAVARAADAIRASEPFRRARALAESGLQNEAEAELAGLRRTEDADPAGLLALAESAWTLGLPREGMRDVSILKRRTDAGILSGGLPKSVTRLLFPVAHLDAVLRGAEANNLDPFFVLAVMREESWFDPEAVSGAGARGLLQIMPATGYDLAGRAGLHGFAVRDLFDPATNVRLGARYLRELLDAFDGEPALALAAYNAGKDNAIRWRTGQRGALDVDRYVAGITYGETAGYVQKVIRTWTIYRFLWGDVVARLAAARGSAHGR